MSDAPSRPSSIRRRADRGPNASTESSWLSGAPLPISVRARLGREITADLDGAYAAFVARGLSPARALERATALVVPGTAATEHLARVHRPLYAALVRRFPTAATRRGERVAFVLVAGVTLLLLAAALRGLDLSLVSVPFVAPILTLGSALLASLVAKAFHLFVKGAPPSAARRGLGVPLALSLLLVLLALVAGLTELYRFALAVADQPPVDFAPFVDFVGSTATSLSLALGLALAGALGWFLLLHSVVSAEEAEPTLTPHLQTGDVP